MLSDFFEDRLEASRFVRTHGCGADVSLLAEVNHKSSGRVFVRS